MIHIAKINYTFLLFHRKKVVGVTLKLEEERRFDWIINFN